MRIHTGERPFKCKKCQKGFKALGQLKDHLISHTGYKPFQCPHCKKFYRRKEILKNHIIIHAKEPCFKNNQEKFNEMMNKVKEMKHIKHTFYDMDTNYKNNSDVNINFISSVSKDEGKQNFATFKIKNINDIKNTKVINFKKDENKKIENNNETNLIEKTYLNKMNDDFLIDDKLFKDDRNVWPNELNNLLSSTDDMSIKEENNIHKDSEKIDFGYSNFNFQNDENQNNICIKNIKPNLKLCINFYDDNIEDESKDEGENEDSCSKMTNLYINEYDKEKEINDFVNNF